ncbi:MAG: urea ABC transporter permease subunit UrtC, partial [Verrucomicrobiota bacterium]
MEHRGTGRGIPGLKDASDRVFVGLVVAAMIALPLGNWLVSPESPFYVSAFSLGVWGKYLCYAVLAISLNMMWGYTGLLCLGHCLFFALGGYAFGMYLMLMIGELGSYQSHIPDFMVFLGYEQLPAHWRPFYNPFFAIAA